VKTNRKNLSNQRTLIARKARAWTAVRSDQVPQSGWIKAVRGALGMTTRELAARLGVQQSTITRLEEREVSGKVTLDVLSRAAEAMHCKLVYAIVPDDRYADLEEIVDEQARKVARQLVRRAEHSMRLEQQGSDSSHLAKQADALTEELKSRMDRRIWTELSAPHSARKRR
jgi:predicted DNA-binding mobile mystery protein A